jgi:hypothetical protein
MVHANARDAGAVTLGIIAPGGDSHHPFKLWERWMIFVVDERDFRLR